MLPWPPMSCQLLGAMLLLISLIRVSSIVPLAPWRCQAPVLGPGRGVLVMRASLPRVPGLTSVPPCMALRPT